MISEDQSLFCMIHWACMLLFSKFSLLIEYHFTQIPSFLSLIFSRIHIFSVSELNDEEAAVLNFKKMKKNVSFSEWIRISHSCLKHRRERFQIFSLELYINHLIKKSLSNSSTPRSKLVFSNKSLLIHHNEIPSIKTEVYPDELNSIVIMNRKDRPALLHWKKILDCMLVMFRGIIF